MNAAETFQHLCSEHGAILSSKAKDDFILAFHDKEHAGSRDPHRNPWAALPRTP